MTTMYIYVIEQIVYWEVQGPFEDWIVFTSTEYNTAKQRFLDLITGQCVTHVSRGMLERKEDDTYKRSRALCFQRYYDGFERHERDYPIRFVNSSIGDDRSLSDIATKCDQEMVHRPPHERE